MTSTSADRVTSPLSTADVAMHAPRTLDLRQMTGFEEEYVARHQGASNLARVCNEVLAMCLVPPGDDPGERRHVIHDLLVAERDRELVRLRTMSLGSTVNARVDCVSCAEPNSVDFSLDSLPLDFSVGPRQIELAVHDVGQVVLRLPTAKDQQDLLDTAVESEAAQLSWLLARCIQRFGRENVPVDETFSRGLTAGVRHQLDAALSAAVPELDLEMNVNCVACGASFSAPFDIASFFFSK